MTTQETTQELLHSAADRTADLYRSARDYAQEAGYEARERARSAGRYARHASDVGLGFLGAHALPLTVIGVGVGLLALSIRNEARLRGLEVAHRRVPTLRRELREPRASSYVARVSDGTTESTKLLGVRAIEVGRSSDFGPTS